MTRHVDPAGADRAREMIAQLLAGADAGANQRDANRDDIARLERENVALQDLIAANHAAADMLESAMIAAGFFAPRPCAPRLIPLDIERKRA